jgi:hypothetical protein
MTLRERDMAQTRHKQNWKANAVVKPHTHTPYKATTNRVQIILGAFLGERIVTFVPSADVNCCYQALALIDPVVVVGREVGASDSKLMNRR